MDLFILASSPVINAIQAVFGIPDEDAALPRMNQPQMSDPLQLSGARSPSAHTASNVPRINGSFTSFCVSSKSRPITCTNCGTVNGFQVVGPYIMPGTAQLTCSYLHSQRDDTLPDYVVLRSDAR
ncbi:hypothetical protein RB195_021507 [Necator americanus]|uniref:Uncharacterized protein n=1 Tax=Necator americanus TaxID=51031 RepID=A0ABR1EBE0_NECAM